MSQNKDYNFLPTCIVIDIRSNIIVFSSNDEIDTLKFSQKSVYYRAYRSFGWLSGSIK